MIKDDKHRTELEEIYQLVVLRYEFYCDISPLYLQIECLDVARFVSFFWWKFDPSVTLLTD